MLDPQHQDASGPARNERFQFGLRRLLVLTTICTVAAALAGSLGGPVAGRFAAALFLMSIAAYVVLRLPYVCRRLVRAIRERQRIARHRLDLAALAAQRKREIEQARAAAAAQPPSSAVPDQRP